MVLCIHQLVLHQVVDDHMLVRWYQLVDSFYLTNFQRLYFVPLVGFHNRNYTIWIHFELVQVELVADFDFARFG